MGRSRPYQDLDLAPSLEGRTLGAQVGSDGLGVYNIVLKLRYDGVGVYNTLVNVGNHYIVSSVWERTISHGHTEVVERTIKT